MVWAQEYLKQGPVPTQRGFTFAKYANDWWVWDKCPYIKGKLARGKTISKRYAEESRRNLYNHLIPHWRDWKLNNIKPFDVEDWLMESYENSGLNPATLNRILATFKVMMKEAVRFRYIQDDPTKDVGILKEHPEIKTILSKTEVKTLFNEREIQKNWNGDLIHFTLNLLAASTGMRMGELQGIERRYVHDTFIEVNQAWSRKHGLKDPKSSSHRPVPVPSTASKYLKLLIDQSVNLKDDDLVFHGKDPKKPIDNKTIAAKFYDALEKIDITPEERKQKNITFHSWRHFFNTMCRGKVPDSKLQRVTGHKTQEMTEHYTHFQLEDYAEVRKIQEGMFYEV